MTKILAIDASSEACSVALLNNNEIVDRYDVVPRKHTELILPMVDEVLAEAGLSLSQLDAIAFNRGPGSFTGVRVSTSVAQGLAYAVDLPVIPVSGLATVAQGAWRSKQHGNVIVMLDARMEEVYWAYYQITDNCMKLVGEEHVSPAGNISKPGEADWIAVGSGVNVYNKEIQEWVGNSNIKLNMDSQYPQARDVAELARMEFVTGNAVTAMQAQPVYIRDKVV